MYSFVLETFIFFEIITRILPKIAAIEMAHQSPKDLHKMTCWNCKCRFTMKTEKQLRNASWYFKWLKAMHT